MLCMCVVCMYVVCDVCVFGVVYVYGMMCVCICACGKGLQHSTGGHRQRDVRGGVHETQVHRKTMSQKIRCTARKIVKNTCCSYREPRFDSQHPQGGSQPPVTPALGDLMTSSDLHRHQTLRRSTYTHVYKNTHA